MQIILYSKPNCSLCDTLLDDLVWLQRELEFTVKSEDIGNDPTLKEKFQYFVPVLDIGGTLYNPPHDLLQTRQRIITAMRDLNERNSAQNSSQNSTQYGATG